MSITYYCDFVVDSLVPISRRIPAVFAADSIHCPVGKCAACPVSVLESPLFLASCIPVYHVYVNSAIALTAYMYISFVYTWYTSIHDRYSSWTWLFESKCIMFQIWNCYIICISLISRFVFCVDRKSESSNTLNGSQWALLYLCINMHECIKHVPATTGIPSSSAVLLFCQAGSNYQAT